MIECQSNVREGNKLFSFFSQKIYFDLGRISQTEIDRKSLIFYIFYISKDKELSIKYDK